MNQLIEWLSRIFSSWKFWIIIAPWDVGIRVRFGRIAARLNPGPHFRLPFLDEITIVNTSLRIDTTPTVTLPSSQPGKARVVTAAIGYTISDPVKAVLKYSYPGGVLASMAQAAIAANADETSVLNALREQTARHGIQVEFVCFTENVAVRTYRIINGGGGFYGGGGVPSMVNERVTHY